jgi:FO synthase
MTALAELCRAARDGARLSEGESLSLAAADARDLDLLMGTAAALRDRGHGSVITYSKKVFFPLTHLCRDSCGYCVFAQPPKRGEDEAYLSRARVLAEARRAAELDCKEALFTLGDKPELRYRVARDHLRALGHETTLSYLRDVAAQVRAETGLFPHLNPGVMTASDLRALRPVSISMGLMLESISEALLAPGGAHHRCPDKIPASRLETIRLAGELAIPFTTGILIGIGETRADRIRALLAIRELHDRYGHVQEVIVQSFRRKPGTRMADAPEPTAAELFFTIAAARMILGPNMNIQAPPNLTPEDAVRLIGAGINDFGGVSPLTPDYVNPEAPWPHLEALARRTEEANKTLVERLAIYPEHARAADRWIDPALRPAVISAIDTEGYARPDRWLAGAAIEPPPRSAPSSAPSRMISAVLDRARRGRPLSEGEIALLFSARGADEEAVTAAADELRREAVGDEVTYVVNRNINYTNVCSFRCRFCAFSKGRLSENLRGRPYKLELEEIARRAEEAWARGATEVCMQGGIHPDYTGETYIDIVRAVKEAVPAMHVHAFSPLEIREGARALGIGVEAFLARLARAGLGSLPGTAAEILDDEVRAILCPDKISAREWLEVIETAHRLGLSTTATIMFGHVDRPRHWARHLLLVRELQARTGGFTEMVPLPFVPMEAPLYKKGMARNGPTFRESIAMHAVSRLALHPHLLSIQTSWVKMGASGAARCLTAGANDLGGTLMNESITRAAGAVHGQELSPAEIEGLVRRLPGGRVPRQRTTKYGRAAPERTAASHRARPLLRVL